MKIYTRKKVLKKGTIENGYDWYFELFFNEYDDNGRLIRKGSEDFNKERLKTLKRYEVRVDSGRKNKNGSVITEPIGNIYIANGITAIKSAKLVYGNHVVRTERLPV